MTHLALLAQLAVVVGTMLCLGMIAIVGRERIRRVRHRYRERIRVIAPYLAVLAAVLVVNKVARRFAPAVSWIIGWNVTGVIYDIEGTAVAGIQSIATPPLTAYFSFMYVYGYAFVLVFPLLAYFALDDGEPLRETVLAYAFNYGIGLCCYVAFIAYGPRNLMPGLVESLLYTHWPQSQLLTSQVNTNTNVFPSLHASLSVTVVLLAYRTRDVYPRWLSVATAFAGSIVVSTMYLGIHWAFDVLAGGALAAISVYAATRVVPETGGRGATRRFRTWMGLLR